MELAVASACWRLIKEIAYTLLKPFKVVRLPSLLFMSVEAADFFLVSLCRGRHRVRSLYSTFAWSRVWFWLKSIVLFLCPCSGERRRMIEVETRWYDTFIIYSLLLFLLLMLHASLHPLKTGIGLGSHQKIDSHVLKWWCAVNQSETNERWGVLWLIFTYFTYTYVLLELPQLTAIIISFWTKRTKLRPWEC